MQNFFPSKEGANQPRGQPKAPEGVQAARERNAQNLDLSRSPQQQLDAQKWKSFRKQRYSRDPQQIVSLKHISSQDPPEADYLPAGLGAKPKAVSQNFVQESLAPEQLKAALAASKSKPLGLSHQNSLPRNRTVLPEQSPSAKPLLTPAFEPPKRAIGNALAGENYYLNQQRLYKGGKNARANPSLIEVAPKQETATKNTSMVQLSQFVEDNHYFRGGELLAPSRNVQQNFRQRGLQQQRLRSKESSEWLPKSHATEPQDLTAKQRALLQLEQLRYAKLFKDPLRVPLTGTEPLPPHAEPRVKSNGHLVHKFKSDRDHSLPKVRSDINLLVPIQAADYGLEPAHKKHLALQHSLENSYSLPAFERHQFLSPQNANQTPLFRYPY